MMQQGADLVSGTDPVRFVCAGMGGYAWSIAQRFLEQDALPSPDAKLVAMCDPAVGQFADRVAMLDQRGIKCYPDYQQMLSAEKADAVWLPIPIHLHLPFTEQALSSGLNVVTEKPVAGSVQEVDRMIAARDRAGKEVLVGFQDIYAAPTVPAKRLILDGALGRITHATVHASWPRDLAYFGRNKWAGAIRVGNDWVLDSPVQNAISHYLNLCLFLLGTTPATSSQPVEIEAELYRANSIENFDTCALRITLAGGIKLLVFFTHADTHMHGATVHIQGERGQLRIDDDGFALTGEHTAHWPQDQNKHASMIRNISQRFRGSLGPDRAVATLEIARVHTTIINAASQCAPITPFGAQRVHDAVVGQTPAGQDRVMRAVDGVTDVMLRCVEKRQLPSELGDVAWASPGGRMAIDQYSHFPGPFTSQR